MKARKHFPVIFAMLAITFACDSPPLRAQDQTPELTFVALTPGQVFQVDGLELTESFDPTTYERHDYIRRPEDALPREFYRHSRGISVALSRKHNLLLVDDDYTTKLSKLVVVDLGNLLHTDVSSDAVATYRREANMGERNWTNARALSLSPAGDKLLVEVRVTYLDASTAQEAAKESALYPPRQYVVNVASGKVREVFLSGVAPEHWY